MEWLILAGRLLWSVVFLTASKGHLLGTDATAAYAAAKGVPFARLSVQVSGVFLVVTSLMVVFGVWADLAFLLQAAWLVATAFKMHAFWRDVEPMGRRGDMINFEKNLSLAGAALMLFVLFALGGGQAFHLTLTRSLFDFGL